MDLNRDISNFIDPVIQDFIYQFIDVDPDTALERIARNRFHQELFEKKSRLVEVRENYKKAFDLLAGEEKYTVIDGNQSREAIADNIWEAVRGYFGL